MLLCCVRVLCSYTVLFKGNWLSFEEDYREDSGVMTELLDIVVNSLDKASRDGVTLTGGTTLFPIPIGNKGDWPYLVACRLGTKRNSAQGT